MIDPVDERGLNPILKQSLELLGLPLVAPEPEVLQRDLARIQCKSLARCIARLLNENEPLLRAEQDGATVTVREIGGPVMMRFEVRHD